MNDLQKEPKVSVVILNFNRPEHTVACVHSVLESTYANLEIIVVDNCSEILSFGLLKKKIEALDVRLIQAEHNLGYSGGNNVGILHSTGKYILLLNDDVTIDNKLIHGLVDIAEKNDTVGIIGPATYCYGSNKLWFYPPEILKTNSTVVDVPIVVGAALMIKRAVIERVGLLDENYFMYHEEWDWCARVRDQGYRTVCAPRLRVWHKVQEQGTSYSPTWAYYFHRNFFLLAARHCRTTREATGFLFRHLVWYEKKKVPIFYPLIALRNEKAQAVKAYFAAMKDGVVLFLKLAYTGERRGNC